MRVDRDDAIKCLRQQLADNLLANRLAVMERRVLAHITKIGCHQNEPSRTTAPQGFTGEQQRKQLVIRLMQRGIDERRLGRLAYCDAQFLVGKAVGLDLMQGKSEPPREPPSRPRSGWQAL